MTSDAWLDRSLVQLPFYLALVVSEDQYYEVLESLSVPRADHGTWIANEQSSGTTSTFSECTDGEGKKGPLVVVAIRPSMRDPITVAGLLVHEAVHVFQHWCEHMGERRPSSEFEAYSIQWISQCLMWSYRDQVFPQPTTKE